MGFKDSSRTLERFYLALLSMSVFGFSATSECDSFGLRSDRDDGGGWRCVRFQDSSDCFMCRWRSRNIDHAELVLPCFDPSGSFKEADIQITYLFRRGNSGSEGSNQVPLNVHEDEETNCNDGYSLATLLDEAPMTPISQRPQLSDFRVDHLFVQDINQKTSYRLNIVTSMGSFPSMSIVCLTNVEFIRSETTVAASTEIALTTTNVTTARQVRSETTVAASTEIALTTTNVTTARQEKTQRKFPIWVIFVIIAIVIISICAVALFICRRNQHDHQPANNVYTGRVNFKSNGRKDNMNNDKDVIANPTYGQEPVNGKEAEYHSYTEIDVKIPDNSDMIYNSAYEIPPASSDMVYNSAYESSPSN